MKLKDLLKVININEYVEVIDNKTGDQYYVRPPSPLYKCTDEKFSKFADTDPEVFDVYINEGIGINTIVIECS